jgi:hypothetical protein
MFVPPRGCDCCNGMERNKVKMPCTGGRSRKVNCGDIAGVSQMRDCRDEVRVRLIPQRSRRGTCDAVVNVLTVIGRNEYSLTFTLVISKRSEEGDAYQRRSGIIAIHGLVVHASTSTGEPVCEGGGLSSSACCPPTTL